MATDGVISFAVATAAVLSVLDHSLARKDVCSSVNLLV